MCDKGLTNIVKHSKSYTHQVRITTNVEHILGSKPGGREWGSKDAEYYYLSRQKDLVLVHYFVYLFIPKYIKHARLLFSTQNERN